MTPLNDEAFTEIQQIRVELRDQGGILRSLLHAQAGHIEEEIRDRMSRDPMLARVFLLIDGTRSQRDVVAALQAEGRNGASQPTISRKMKMLAEELGVIAPIARASDGGVIYHATAVAEALRTRRAAEMVLRDARE